MPISIFGEIHLECLAHFFLTAHKLAGYNKNLFELSKRKTELQK